MPSQSDRPMGPQDIATLLVAAFVLISVVAVKYCSDGKIEISINDVLIATVAAVLMLFVTGRISEFEFGTKGVSVKTALIAATNKPIERQVIPVKTLLAPEKGPVDQIPQYIGQQVPAIHFTPVAPDSARYDGNAIKRYLNALTSHNFFRFVIFLDARSKLFGMIDARQLKSQLENANSDLNFVGLATLLNRGQEAMLGRLTGLLGFVPVSSALKRTTDRQDALKRMESLGVDWLPVVEEDGSFAGIVEQSQLTASLILDVADRLKDRSGASG